MELIIDKLKKVKELADRGEDGEALNARQKLHILLNKHGLTISDLENVKISQYKFKYSTVAEMEIMIQCIAKVTNDPKLTYSWYKDKKKEFFVKLAEWQYIESMALIDFHVVQFRKELKAQMKALKSAYCSKHHLFPDKKSDKEGPELNLEEMERLLAVYNSLGSKFYQKQIG